MELNMALISLFFTLYVIISNDGVWYSDWIKKWQLDKTLRKSFKMQLLVINEKKNTVKKMSVLVGRWRVYRNRKAMTMGAVLVQSAGHPHVYRRLARRQILMTTPATRDWSASVSEWGNCNQIKSTASRSEILQQSEHNFKEKYVSKVQITESVCHNNLVVTTSTWVYL
jgi:hypothetical protein